jgi:hypothetical protein
VYVDWLLERGDEVAELAALALRDANAARDWLLQNPRLLGEVDVCYGHELELAWRHGLVRGMKIRDARPTPALRRPPKHVDVVMRGALACPLSRCLTEVDLRGRSSSRVVDAATQLCGALGGQLTHLGLVMNAPGPAALGGLFERLPVLRSLHLSVSGSPEAWLMALEASPLLARLDALTLSIPHAPRPDAYLAEHRAAFAQVSKLTLEFFDP